MTAYLPADVQEIIKAKIAGGEFTSEAEVLAAGVRLLQEKGELMRKHVELRALIQEGVDSAERGELFDADDVFDEVLRDLDAADAS